MVTTDNWPLKHIYVSRRLSRQIIDKHMAAEQGLVGELTLGTGDVNVKLGSRDVDVENQFALVRAATDAVKNHTGSLKDPKEYVHDALDMRACSFRVLSGWEQGANKEVAGFCADTWVDDVGLVFVALFGSIYNFLGYSKEERETTGWYPSSLDGLYQLLAEMVEPEDSGISPQWLAMDQDLDDDERCRMAATVFFTPQLPLPERLEFLAQTFISRRDLELRGEAWPAYDLVIVGTPIWVAKQFPRDYLKATPDPRLPTPDAGREHRGKRWWRRFLGVED
jgi:hypothetical protein